MSDKAAALPKLLCVDDEDVVLAAVSRLLGKDFQVLTARSADEAIKLLDSHPDLAICLTDQRMAGMSGLDLLAVVQQQIPDAVRAVISASVEPADMAMAINTNRIHRLILKPWNNEYFRLQMLEALANHSVLREKSMLEKLSVTDPVTGLKNHRYFQDQLKIEAERALRHNREVSLIMIDIDHFKMFNDRFGHPAGDTLLQTVARRLQDQVRSIDTVARYGGEEFAIILPDTSFDHAFQVAERIRSVFANNPYRHPYEGPSTESVPLTISLGVANLPKHVQSTSELIARADAALYQAKGQGRNQTVGA